MHSCEAISTTLVKSPSSVLCFLSPGSRLLLGKTAHSASLASSLCLLLAVGLRMERLQVSGMRLLFLSVLSSMKILKGQGYR